MTVACGSGVRSFVVLGCLWNEVRSFVCQRTSTEGADCMGQLGL